MKTRLIFSRLFPTCHARWVWRLCPQTTLVAFAIAAACLGSALAASQGEGTNQSEMLWGPITATSITDSNKEPTYLRVINQIRQDHRYASKVFTSKAYRSEALRLVIQEANVVAKQLALPEELPITKSSIIKAYISPFSDAYISGAIGNVTTRNYWYFISRGNKFSMLTRASQEADCRRYQELYTWPLSRLETNQACALALGFLAAASMDVQALTRDCKMTVSLDNVYVRPPAGKFVPVYDISWKPRDNHSLGVANVRLCTPTKTLLQLTVVDPKYILRPPLVFTNLDVLLSDTNLPPQSRGAAP